MSKQIVSGGPVSVSVSVAGGVVSLQANVQAALGGGVAAGVVQGQASMGLSLSVEQAANLGLELMKGALPSLSAEIAVVEAAVDAEIEKLAV